jgi:predicted metal-dependent peptidase
MAAKLTPKQSIQVARKVIRGAAPYFSSLLYRITFHEIPAAECASPTNPHGFATLGMSDSGQCYYNPEYIGRLSPAELAAAVFHELLHFNKQDVSRFRAWLLSHPGEEQLTNIASDIANNDDLIACGFALPGRPLTEQEYKTQKDVTDIYWMPESIGMPEGRTAHEYLEKLLKDRQGKGNKPGQQPGSGQGSGGGGSGTGTAPKCGSCAGHADAVEKALGLGGNKPGQQPGKPGAPSAPAPGITEAEADAIRAQVARDVIAHIQQKGRGSVGGSLARWAEDKIKPPKVPWQQKLQRAVRRACQKAAGAQDFSYTKTSRRQGGMGYGLGVPRMPAMHGTLPQVAVVLDTSGSMDDSQLKAGLSETAGILQAVGGGVTFCAIDCATAGLIRVKTWQEAANKLKGGGGTDMKPAFKLLEESRTPPSVTIVLTDGMIGDPGPEPKAKVIWVLLGSKYRQDVSKFGEVIEVDTAEAA